MWSTWCCIQRSHIMTTHHILTPNHCHHVYPSYESFCHRNPISCWCHLYHSLGCSNPSETDLLPLDKDKGDQGVFVQYHKFKGGQRGNCVRSCKLTHYSLWCREGNHNPSLVSCYVLCSAASWTQDSDHGAQRPCLSASKDRWGDWSSLLWRHFAFRSTHRVNRLATSLWPCARPRTHLGKRHTSRSPRDFSAKETHWWLDFALSGGKRPLILCRRHRPRDSGKLRVYHAIDDYSLMISHHAFGAIAEDASGWFNIKIEEASTLFGVGEGNKCQTGRFRSANRFAHHWMKEEAQQAPCGDREVKLGGATPHTPQEDLGDVGEITGCLVWGSCNNEEADQ